MCRVFTLTALSNWYRSIVDPEHYENRKLSERKRSNTKRKKGQTHQHQQPQQQQQPVCTTNDNQLEFQPMHIPIGEYGTVYRSTLHRQTKCDQQCR